MSGAGVKYTWRLCLKTPLIFALTLARRENWTETFHGRMLVLSKGGDSLSERRIAFGITDANPHTLTELSLSLSLSLSLCYGNVCTIE